LSAVTDGEFGYFGTNTIPGGVVKVRLSDMTRVDAVTFDDGERNLFSAVTDGTFGYFGTSTSPGQVVKVRLSDMTRVDAVTFADGENNSVSAVTDGTFGYFGTNTSPGQVVKVRLSDMTRVDAVIFDDGENNLLSAVTDGEYGYFGTDTRPGRVVKVRLSDMTRVGAVTFADGERTLWSAVTDGEFGYFGTENAPGRVVKVRLSDMARVGALTFDDGESGLFSAVTDGEFGYFGTWTSPGRVVKVRLSDLTRVGAVTLDDEESNLFSAVTDGEFGYFGTWTDLGRVVKVRFSQQAPQEPFDVVVTPDFGELVVSWSAPGDDGGAPVTRYTVTVSPGEQSCSTSSAVPGQPPAVSCVVSGLSQAGRYRVTVDATNDVGPSVPSAPSVEVTPGAGSAVPEFVDVPSGSFFVRATSMLKVRGITEGTNPAGDVYSPQRLVNRQQMALFLWRMAGSPDGPASCGFGDEASIAVSARVAACWLKAEDITTNNPYNPLGVVNRQQMAAFLWRFAGLPDASASCGFTDEAAISTFARVPACWLKATDITTNNPYRPTGDVTRAQMAAFLYRLGAELDLWLRDDT